MAGHFTEYELPYKADQLFDLVANIKEYPRFLPWCDGARILEDNGEVVIAELIIGYKAVSGRYTSRVLLDRKDKEISVELVQGPFHHLYNGWKFVPVKGGTRVVFDVEFKMRNFVFEKIMDVVFDDACKKAEAAFKRRAQELYG